MTVTDQSLGIDEIEKDLIQTYMDKFIERTGHNPVENDEALVEWLSSTEFRQWRRRFREKLNSRW